MISTAKIAALHEVFLTTKLQSFAYDSLVCVTSCKDRSSCSVSQLLFCSLTSVDSVRFVSVLNPAMDSL